MFARFRMHFFIIGCARSAVAIFNSCMCSCIWYVCHIYVHPVQCVIGYHLDCRDGCSSRIISFQPVANQARWSSRKFVRAEVVNHVCFGILCTESDQRT